MASITAPPELRSTAVATEPGPWDGIARPTADELAWLALTNHIDAGVAARPDACWTFTTVRLAERVTTYLEARGAMKAVVRHLRGRLGKDVLDAYIWTVAPMTKPRYRRRWHAHLIAPVGMTWKMQREVVDALPEHVDAKDKGRALNVQHFRRDDQILRRRAHRSELVSIHDLPWYGLRVKAREMTIGTAAYFANNVRELACSGKAPTGSKLIGESRGFNPAGTFATTRDAFFAAVLADVATFITAWLEAPTGLAPDCGDYHRDADRRKAWADDKDRDLFLDVRAAEGLPDPTIPVPDGTDPVAWATFDPRYDDGPIEPTIRPDSGPTQTEPSRAADPGAGKGTGVRPLTALGAETRGVGAPPRTTPGAILAASFVDDLLNLRDLNQAVEHGPPEPLEPPDLDALLT